MNKFSKTARKHMTALELRRVEKAERRIADRERILSALEAGIKRCDREIAKLTAQQRRLDTAAVRAERACWTLDGMIEAVEDRAAKRAGLTRSRGKAGR